MLPSCPPPPEPPAVMYHMVEGHRQLTFEGHKWLAERSAYADVVTGCFVRALETIEDNDAVARQWEADAAFYKKEARRKPTWNVVLGAGLVGVGVGLGTGVWATR